MYIERIKLENFRNYDEKEFSFTKDGSFLCGRNASGKTNLLEAIYMLSYGKSFRTSNCEDMIMHSKDYFGIEGSFCGNRNKKIEFRFAKGRRKITVNEVEISAMKELVGNVAVVLLSLEDINIITGEPAIRRRYLNFLLSLLYKDYLSDLLDYRKVLRQRNRILYMKKIGERNNISGIEGWTGELVSIGSRIIDKRLSIMEELNDYVRQKYRIYSGGDDELNIEYSSSLAMEGNIEEDFGRSLDKKKGREMERGTTLVGPHRDELVVTINGQPARRFGSEGEQRTCAIAFKCAQASFLGNKRNDEPILLIDEAVAELDRDRTERVLKNLSSTGQCFVATTNCSIISDVVELETIDIGNEKSR
jgi:DNA replication and repair protein RecF